MWTSCRWRRKQGPEHPLEAKGCVLVQLPGGKIVFARESRSDEQFAPTSLEI